MSASIGQATLVPALRVGNTFRRDNQVESESGDSLAMTNVFHRDPDGTIRHLRASEVFDAPTDDDQDPTPQGTLEPLYLFLTQNERPK